jgi:hypothetical protein
MTTTPAADAPTTRPDPRDLPRFVAILHGAVGVGRRSLRAALLDLPLGSESDLARVDVLVAEDGAAPAKVAAALAVVRGLPTDESRALLSALEGAARHTLVAVHARDLDPSGDDAVREAWTAIVGAERVYLTSTPASPEGSPARGVVELRAALFTLALEDVDLTVAEARRAKRPYAAAIIASAAFATAAEGLLPGAAALVMTTQVGAIGSLSYLYTGRFIGRGQALGLIPVFATEAAGGSLFLLAKSFFPPTGIADAAAAAVAATLTLSMLGAVAFTLEEGYSLDQKDKLREAFRRLRARSVADRAELLKQRGRWKDRGFWTEIAQKWLFEG